MTRRSLLSLPFLAPSRRNILLIVADDMNNDLACYGDPVARTPALDRLARRGVVFDRAYCQYPLCQPSRTSFLSGKNPENTKVWTLQTPTRRHLGDAVMLPELFRKNGYFSAHAGKIFHTGEHAEDPHSWDEEFREFGKNPPPDQVLREDRSPGPRGHSFAWQMLKTRDEDTPDGMVARKTVGWLEQCARQSKPFFIGCGFRRPHSPYSAPKRYFDLYPPGELRLPEDPPSHYDKLLPAAINHDAPAPPLSVKTIREHLAAYYAVTSFMDAQVGVVLDSLDRLKLWESTVVVFLGDHGYHLGDHGGLWHKSTLFERACRVPLLVAAPGARGAGRSTRALTELIDLYPSLAAQCGVKPPAGLDGRDFTAVLNDPAREFKKAAYSMVGRGEERAESVKEIKFTGRTVRTDRWRYTEWDGGRQGVELYDHRAGARELVNLAADPALKGIRAEHARLLR